MKGRRPSFISKITRKIKENKKANSDEEKKTNKKQSHEKLKRRSSQVDILSKMAGMISFTSDSNKMLPLSNNEISSNSSSTTSDSDLIDDAMFMIYNNSNPQPNPDADRHLVPHAPEEMRRKRKKEKPIQSPRKEKNAEKEKGTQIETAQSLIADDSHLIQWQDLLTSTTTTREKDEEIDVEATTPPNKKSADEISGESDNESEKKQVKNTGLPRADSITGSESGTSEGSRIRTSNIIGVCFEMPPSPKRSFQPAPFQKKASCNDLTTKTGTAKTGFAKKGHAVQPKKDEDQSRLFNSKSRKDRAAATTTTTTYRPSSKTFHN